MIYRYRWLFIVAPLVIAIGLLIPLREARINPDLNAYLPDDMPARQSIRRLDSIFGKYEPVLVFFETNDVLAAPTLERVRDLSGELHRRKEFSRVMSLFDVKNIRGEEGAMIVEPAVRRIPKTDEAREKLRQELRGNDLAYGLTVSEDFRYALLLANPAEGVPDDESVAILEGLLEQFPGDEKVYLNGSPYLKHEIQVRTTRDLAILLPLGLLAMILFLYFSFREIRGVLLPLSVVVLSIILSMGLLPLFGWELSIMAILVPIMMIAIANNYGVHLISRYQEMNARFPGMNMREIVGSSLAHLWKPILFTALTTIVGVLGLVTHIMLPAKQMGIVSAIGIAFAFVLSLVFVPSIMIMMKKGKAQAVFSEEKHTWIERLLGWLARLSAVRPKSVVFVFAGLLVLMGLGIARLQVNVQHENILPPSHPVRVSTGIADRHFGGVKNATLLWEGDMKAPSILNRMEAAEHELEGMPEVGHVISLATMLRKMSQAMNDPGEEAYGKIPATREAVAQYLEFYSMSGDPADLEQLVDFDYTRSAMTVQFRASDLKTFNRVTGKLDAIVEREPACTMLSGHSLMEKELATSIVRGQNYSLIFAAVAIALLLFIIFRSVTAGLLGSLPLAFALISNFGLMGWLGIELDIATSLLSSIAIGIGIDYTIHLFWRLQVELREGLSYPEAIMKTLLTTGRGITINAFSVMLGFGVLFFSALSLLKAFALLIVFSLLLCLLCALLLIPALSVWLRPAFLEEKNKNHENSISGRPAARVPAELPR